MSLLLAVAVAAEHRVAVVAVVVFDREPSRL
jgi:hypothetical protein